jgi:hypothetical protein
MEAGAEDDTFVMFQGGGLQYPLDNAPVWRYIAKDGLKSPPVKAVEEFRKAVEESEKRHRSSNSSNNRARKKVHEAGTALAPSPGAFAKTVFLAVEGIVGPGPLSLGERESTGSR